MSAALSPDVVARIEDLIRQGWRAPAIAREVGVARSSVAKIEHRLGIFHDAVHPAAPGHAWRNYGQKLRFRPDTDRKTVR